MFLIQLLFHCSYVAKGCLCLNLAASQHSSHTGYLCSQWSCEESSADHLNWERETSWIYPPSLSRLSTDQWVQGKCLKWELLLQQLDSECWKAEISASDISGTRADAESLVLISNFKWGKNSSAQCRAPKHTVPPRGECAVWWLLCFTYQHWKFLLVILFLRRNRKTVYSVQPAECLFQLNTIWRLPLHLEYHMIFTFLLVISLKK